jgi:hypothetical protein
MLFPYDAKGVLDLVGELDRWKTMLDYRGPVPRTWAGRLRRDLEAEAVAVSTSMEGIPVTVEEVHRILAGERPPETREEDAALVRGYRDAMSFVLGRASSGPARHTSWTTAPASSCTSLQLLRTCLGS